jgi:predicted nucleic-acid-binding protein
MIGEIENRSAHLLAIKSDVERQGDFIRFLIKEVEGAAFVDIEDVVTFVKWLDVELSRLVNLASYIHSLSHETSA